MSSSLFQLFYSDDVAGAAAILSRDGLRTASTSIASHANRETKLTKQDINKRDVLGRTVLHLAASKGSLDFVRALLENPTTDVNLIDLESGWSALHRALYHGRIACAQYIIDTRGRDTIKVKDRESNSPFDVLNSTLTGTNPPPLYGDYGGSDLYTFGSNKNNNLGFGDGDDRGHPERVQLLRPSKKDESPITAFRPSRIRDVQMAKMHTAILTTDPKDNVYMCGFNGNTGRLGLSATPSTGTQFLPKQVHGINEQVTSVALGQDHTIAITKSGALYTWGSNQHGQLGYSLDLSISKDNVQRLPRKLVAPLKRIEILGVAASNVHSVCFSKEDLYTWGLNRGQLGYSAGDEGPIQSIPRKVASLPSQVEMVTAIDNATICLLKNKTVMIFANNGYFRINFPLDRFADDFAGVSISSVFRPRQMYAPNIITKVTSAGSTICAVSSMGDVFAFSIPPESTAHMKPVDLGKSIKATRIWSLRRRHMAVRDVAVGQDGTVIISTESGSVWTRIRRAKPKVSLGRGDKEFKFARVGTLTRVVAVRASSAGAYAAIRNDVELRGVEIEKSTLEDDLIHSIPLGEVVDSLADQRGVMVDSSDSGDEYLGDEVPVRRRLDGPWTGLFEDLSPPSDSCDVALVSPDGIRIYAHKAILACRSPSFRYFLQNPASTEFKTNTFDDILEITVDQGVVAIAQLVHYLYTDNVMTIPEDGDQHKAERLQMILQLRSLALKFDLKALADILSSSTYIVLAPQPTLRKNLKSLQTVSPSLVPPDAIVCLADKEVPCHSFILAARCPFFEAMLDNAGMGGGWLASRRREAAAEGTTQFRVQLKHLSWNIMSLVLEHLYVDTEETVFDSVRKGSVDEFLEFVIEILAVANELLLDRLKDVCQSILGRFVTLRNVATILEEADTYAAEQLKSACLDYCALNAEALLENRLLDDLDSDIMADLEERVREKQVERLPISRGEVLLHDLASRYPNLEDEILEEREARQFVSVLGTSLPSSLGASTIPATPVDARHPTSKVKLSTGKKGKKSLTPASSPLLKAVGSDLIFDMEDDWDATSPSTRQVRRPEPAANPWRDSTGKPLKEQPPVFKPNQRFRLEAESVTAAGNHQTWIEVKTPGRGYSPVVGDLKFRKPQTKSAESTPKSASSPQPTPVRPSQVRSHSGLQQHASNPASPSLSTPGASPWKTADRSAPISFTSVQQEQSSPMLASTFPPSTQMSLPPRPKPAPATQPPGTTSTEPAFPRRSSGSGIQSPATTPGQIRSVPGKSFQNQPQRPPNQSPILPDMFPALGSSPQAFKEIIAQQTSEQAARNAKLAPRSLKEIQEEEQFLQWWEQESQRVQEEEIRVKETVQRGRGQHGGGTGRGARGGGRGRGGFEGKGRGGDVRGRGRGGIVKDENGKVPVPNRGR